MRADLVGGEAPAVTALMSSAWANLAKQGTPSTHSNIPRNTAGTAGGGSAFKVQWSPYDNATDKSFKFGASVAESGMRQNKQKQCDFLRWCRGDQAGHNPTWGVQLCTPTTPIPPL